MVSHSIAALALINQKGHQTFTDFQSFHCRFTTNKKWFFGPDLDPYKSINLQSLLTFHNCFEEVLLKLLGGNTYEVKFPHFFF
jgi:hypothetical protein